MLTGQAVVSELPAASRYQLAGAEVVMTPALIIYSDIVGANIRNTIRLLGGDTNRWRPHVKTAKLAMTMKLMVVEIGMGTDIRGADYTKAAVRALRDALWHNSLNVADAVGKPTDSMVVEVLIGVPKPDRVNKAEVLAVLPHGTGTVTVVEGGLEIFNDAGTSSTVIANAAAIVRLDVS